MNKIILLGNLTKDVEIKTLQSGSIVGDVNLATNESYTDKQGNKVNKVSFHRLVIWNKQAEVLAQYTQKGSKLLVEGKIDYQDYEKDGIKKTITKIIVDRFEFAGSKQDNQNNQNQNNYNNQPNNSVPTNNAPVNNAPQNNTPTPTNSQDSIEDVNASIENLPF